MTIEILEFTEGAENARGTTVIIDVFRAFSVACYAYDAGAVRIVTTNSVEEAFRLRNLYRNGVLMGERDEKRIEGFDFGNSPTEIIKTDLSGKVVIQTTTAGTNGLMKAINADMIITGSIVNAGAVAGYLKALKPEHVSLVAMGYKAKMPAHEDLLCAQIIKSELEGSKENFSERIHGLKDSSGKRFFIPENIGFSPPTDFFLCTMLNRFDFILKGERRNDGNIDLIKIETG